MTHILTPDGQSPFQKPGTVIKFKPDLKPDFAAERLLKKANIARDKTNAARSHSLFYKSVWQTNPHKCFECGVTLPDFDKALCHHLVEKRFQSRYSINLDSTENGVLLCLQCHSQAHTDLSRMGYTKNLTLEMTKKYEPFKLKR